MRVSPVSGSPPSSSACAASCRPACPPDKLWTIPRWRMWSADKATRLCSGTQQHKPTQTHTQELTRDTTFSRSRSLAPPRELNTRTGLWLRLTPFSVKYFAGFVTRSLRGKHTMGPFPSIPPPRLTGGRGGDARCNGRWAGCCSGDKCTLARMLAAKFSETLPHGAGSRTEISQCVWWDFRAARTGTAPPPPPHTHTHTQQRLCNSITTCPSHKCSTGTTYVCVDVWLPAGFYCVCVCVRVCVCVLFAGCTLWCRSFKTRLESACGRCTSAAELWQSLPHPPPSSSPILLLLLLPHPPPPPLLLLLPPPPILPPSRTLRCQLLRYINCHGRGLDPNTEELRHAKITFIIKAFPWRWNNIVLFTNMIDCILSVIFQTVEWILVIHPSVS